MLNGRYLKLVGLEINGIEVRIVADKNVQDMTDIYDYLSNRDIQNGTAIWLIAPCSFQIG